MRFFTILSFFSRKCRDIDFRKYTTVIGADEYSDLPFFEADFVK